MGSNKDTITDFRKAVAEATAQVGRGLGEKMPEFSKAMTDMSKSILEAQGRIRAEKIKMEERFRHGTRRTSGRIV